MGIRSRLSGPRPLEAVSINAHVIGLVSIPIVTMPTAIDCRPHLLESDFPVAKVLETIFTPCKHGGPGCSKRVGIDRFDVRWTETNCQAAAAASREVGVAAVNKVPVMDRDLTGLEDEIDRLRVVNFEGDFLVDAQEIAGPRRLVVFDDAVSMCTGDNSHAAVVDVAIVDSVPRSQCVRRIETPIRDVLMPGHELLLLGRWILAEEVC